MPDYTTPTLHESTPYQVAKARIAELSDFSGHRPDSLTRRNGTLIARRAYPFTYPRAFATIVWAANIKELFPEARILRNSVDSKNNARCYFKLEVQA